MVRLPPLNALKAFAVAASEASFTRAGEVLHVTQGAISRQVKQLEVALGVPLFVRTHQKVELTPAGRDLAETLQRLFAEMEVAVGVASGLKRRQMLSVNVPPTFATRWLAPRLSDFSGLYPHIDVSVTTERILTMREARGLDCMVAFGPEAWPGVFCIPVLKERHIMASSPKLWTRGAPPAPGTSTLLHVLDAGQRLPVWEQWIAKHGPNNLDAKPGLNFSTLDQAVNAAISGAGIVIVDEAMVVKELQSGELLRHNALHVDGPNGYWLVMPDHKAVVAEHVDAFKRWVLSHAQLNQWLMS